MDVLVIVQCLEASGVADRAAVALATRQEDMLGAQRFSWVQDQTVDGQPILRGWIPPPALVYRDESGCQRRSYDRGESRMGGQQ